jgi:putative PIN family toxin of toxin-antitoxin system
MMLPLRLVLDTNVIVSAALKPDGLQRTSFLLALTKPARFYVSDVILSEYREVLSRPELHIRKGLRRQFLQLIKNRAHLVSPTHIPQVTGDPDDNQFLACADAARADYLITGNLRHFPKFWKRTKIISTRDFISLVAPHLLS